jgi:hypothetical protein
MTTLGNERADFAGGWEHPLAIVAAGERAGHLDRRVGDILEDEGRDDIGESNTPPIHTPERVIELARECGHADDPITRQRLARIYAMAEALRWTGERAEAAANAGRQPGAESSVGYVGGVRLLRLIRDLVVEVSGPAGLLTGSDAPYDGDVAMTVTTVPAHGIQGGSEQIQMNILGERILGLPKEPQVDRDLPFREIVTGTQR